MSATHIGIRSKPGEGAPGAILIEGSPMASTARASCPFLSRMLVKSYLKPVFVVLSVMAVSVLSPSVISVISGSHFPVILPSLYHGKDRMAFRSCYSLERTTLRTAVRIPHPMPATGQMIQDLSQRFVRKLKARKMAIAVSQ